MQKINKKKENLIYVNVQAIRNNTKAMIALILALCVIGAVIIGAQTDVRYANPVVNYQPNFGVYEY